MKGFVDGALASLSLLRDLSVGWSCPVHCGPSALWPFLSGLGVGLLFGLCLGLAISFYLLRLVSPDPQRPTWLSEPPRATRLRGYLRE